MMIRRPISINLSLPLPPWTLTGFNCITQRWRTLSSFNYLRRLVTERYRRWHKHLFNLTKHYNYYMIATLMIRNTISAYLSPCPRFMVHTWCMRIVGRPTGLSQLLWSAACRNGLLSLEALWRTTAGERVVSGPSDQLKRSMVETPPGGVAPLLLGAGLA